MKAFPTPTFSINDEARVTTVGGEGGMDLRDYFAAMAMQGAIAHGLFNAEKASNNYADFVASVAYQYADAMMDARQP
jgi:hypothetical protein